MFDEDRSEGLNSFREINRYYYKPDSSRCRRDTDLVRKTKPEQLRRGGENQEVFCIQEELRLRQERRHRQSRCGRRRRGRRSRAADSSAAARRRRVPSDSEQCREQKRRLLAGRGRTRRATDRGVGREEAVADEEADLRREDRRRRTLITALAVLNNNNIPAKFVSVPATDKEKRSSNSNADASIKRVVVKRNVASPRSQSPARAASPRAQSPARGQMNWSMEHSQLEPKTEL
ncbi:hypothetical protein Bca101_099845 [Brassica carinata]